MRLIILHPLRRDPIPILIVSYCFVHLRIFPFLLSPHSCPTDSSMSLSSSLTSRTRSANNHHILLAKPCHRQEKESKAYPSKSISKRPQPPRLILLYVLQTRQRRLPHRMIPRIFCALVDGDRGGGAGYVCAAIGECYYSCNQS